LTRVEIAVLGHAASILRGQGIGKRGMGRNACRTSIEDERLFGGAFDRRAKIPAVPTDAVAT